jgi:DNA polymerase III epsilon subunit-like protein
VGYRQNDFINRAIARAVKNKDAKLITGPTLHAKEAKPKESKPKDEKSKEEENPFKNPYDAFLKTWKQSDPLPLIPPGMTMHLCKFGNPLHTDTNYYDLQKEYQTKKPKVKFKHPDLQLDSKSLGPKLRDEIDTLLARSMMGKFGLKPWVDDKNKLRCPEGSPAANQFTDQRMSNCFIVSPATAAGSASRIARRAGSAIANASQVGGRTPGGFQAARDMNNLTQQDFLDMGYDEVSSRMAVGGRIVGAMSGGVGQRFDPSRRSGPSEPYLLGRKEKTQRGKRSTMLAMTNHEMIRSGLIKLPNGDDIGDITDEATFMRVMTQLYENVEPNEFKAYFQNAIPSNLRWEQKGEAKRGIRAFWEATIVEAIANPDHAKLVTQFQVDYNMSSAFEVTLDHFGPAIDSNGRLVSAAGKKIVAGRNAGQGGVHVIMRINPAALFQSSLGFHNGDARSSGIHDSVEGDMHYTATHEFGHLAHFSTALQALGFDVNRMNRYPSNPTHFAGSSTTGGAPAWRPGKENGGWEIDFTNMRNPMNSPSIQLVMDAAQNLKTRQYMGGRGNFNSADLQKDLVEFYDAFTEAVVNNVTDTAEDLMLMAQFAGGEYAASNPIETRAEYYAARRLYGETNSQARMLSPQRYPFNLKPPRPGGRGPVRQSTRNANYVQEFSDAVAASGTGPSRTARIGVPGTPMTSAEVTRRLNDSGSGTFGVRPGTWNLTGAMDMGGGQRRTSLHAQQVQGWVKQDERKARNKNKKPKKQWQPLSAARLRSGITGAMSVEQDKPRYPREATYGSFLGDAQKIFGNAKTWEEFKKIYDETEIIFFDYETTGIDHDSDGRTTGKGSPVQIGAVRMKGGKVIDRLNVFMKPDQPLGEWSAKYLKDKDGNILTDDWLNNQESMLKAHQMLADFAGENAIFGVQYAPFDKDVLDATLEKLGVQWRPSGYLDTKDISEYTLPRWTPENPEGPSKLVKEKILDDGTVIPETRKASNGLADITAYLGVDLGSKHHTADADSEAAGMVMAALIDKAIEKNLPTTVLDMKSQKDRVTEAQNDFEKAIIDFEQQVLERNSGVTGSMDVSLAPQNFRNIVSESTDKQDKRGEKAKNRVDGLEKALEALERTGEWRGGEFGVVLSRGKDKTSLDGFDADVTPRNLTKEEVEKEGLAKFKQELEKKISDSKKEVVLQEFLARTKKERAEQGILDIEDVPEEEYRRLVEEGKELQKRRNDGDIEAFKLDGNQEAVIHVGKAQLDGGVLNPSRTSTAGMGVGSPGDTGALNRMQIGNFNEKFRQDAKKLATYETTMSALNAGQTKFTPQNREEADSINSLLGISSQYGAKQGEELDITALPLRDGIRPLIEDGNRRLTELQAQQTRASKLAARINESPDFGFLSAYPASSGVTTDGYYGRNAAADIPEDVAKYYTEAQNTARGAGPFAIDVNDQDSYSRWEDNLRGSAYLVVGDTEDTIVSNLGPSDERQLVGVNKPIFGVSSRLRSARQPESYDLAAHALMARAVKLKKEGIDPSPEKVLSTPLYQSSRSGGITGAMRTSMKISSTRKSNRKTAEIKRSINEAGGNFGGDTSVRYIKDLKPADTMLGATLISETKEARNKERINVLTALKDVIKTDFTPNEGGPQVAAAAPPGAPPPDGPDDDDWKKNIFDVKNALNGLNPDFHRYLNETPIEELKKELEFSILDFHEGLDKQPRTHVPGRFLKDLIENGFKNSHQRNEIVGLDKILAKYEADIGIHPDTPVELRPASGFVLHMDELQREQNDITKFLKNSGKENPERYFPNLVDFPHSKRTRGNDWNFGNAEVILNHGVADRTAYGNGELFNNHIEPVGMNSSDNEVITRAHIDAAFKTDNRAENIIEHLYNSFKDNHDAYRKEKYATSPGRSWEPREASIAGGFNADDIDEIKIPFDSIPKNFIDGHPVSPATNSAMGKDAYIKESEAFLNGLKEKIISDDAMDRINPTEEERKIIRDMLSSSPKDFVIPDKIQKGMNRFGAAEFDLKQDVDKYLRLEAAEAMRNSMDKKGIKLSITNKYGLNVFDPKAFDKKAFKKTTAKEAIRNKIEKQMEDIISDMREAKGGGDKNNIASGITGAMGMFGKDKKKKPNAGFDGADVESYNPFKNATEESMTELQRQADEEGIVFERSLTGKMSAGRTLDEVVEKGPKTLPYGRDKSGVVKVASTKEHEAKFGRTAAEQTKYFKNKYDLEMEIDDIFDEGDSYKTAHFASLQALDDILSNFDAEDLFGGKAASDMRFRVRRDFTGDEDDEVLGFVAVDDDAGIIEMEIPVGRISRTSDEIADTFVLDTKLRGQALSNLKAQIGKKYHGVHDIFLQFENNNKIPRTPENELKIKANKEEMAKRLAYGVMVHEMGHVLDKLASRKSNDASSWSTSLEKDFGQLPSVTKYGSTNEAEKFAEAFSAWWLFGQNKDLDIVPQFRGGASGELYDFEETEKIRDVASKIVKPIFGRLGSSIKSAKQESVSLDEIPPMVKLYAILSTMKDK